MEIIILDKEMKDLKTLFVQWYFNEFMDIDPLHVEMSNFSEDSPWHRERTIAVHTNMVVGEFLTRAGSKNAENEWSTNDLYGAFACAFHDVGKPAARTEVYKPERGTYYRYGGHELISARLWEDWAVRNWKFLEEEFDMTPHGIYSVGWLIENHLPWDVKKPEKRHQLALGAKHTVHDPERFINVVKADTWGRISDDATEKRGKVNAWCDEFLRFFKEVKEEYKTRYVNPDAPIMYMPIAASGSGKSTLLNSESMDCVLDRNNIDGELLHFSLDKLRHDWYDPDDYRNAFALACEDKEFKNKANKVFADMVKTGQSIYLDNINISKKRRAEYIRQGHKYGYVVYAILLPVELQTVLDRQDTRSDKFVPLDAVKQHYMSLSLPSLGEVDRIIIYSGNLP